VNPSNTNINNATVQGGNFITEDVSMALFMSHLIRLAVQS